MENHHILNRQIIMNYKAIYHLGEISIGILYIIYSEIYHEL